MKPSTKVILITLLFAIPTFFLGKVIWPDPLDNPVPTSAQLPFFVILSVLESLLFGIGIAFAVIAWQWVKSFPHNTLPIKATYISLIWILVQWWPHDNLHRWNGLDLQGILYIDYAFHVTIMLASLVILFFFVSVLKEKITPKDIVSH